MSTFHKSHFTRKFTGKMPRLRLSPERGHTLLPAQSKRMCTCLKSHFAERFTGKMPRPRTQTHTSCEPARSKFMSRFHKQLHSEIYRKDAAPQIGPRTQTHTLCELAQSKCTSTFHNRHQKCHFTQKFAGKMLHPRLGLERGHTLCASLRSRNAGQHFTRAAFCENLQVKCQTRGRAP